MLKSREFYGGNFFDSLNPLKQVSCKSTNSDACFAGTKVQILTFYGGNFLASLAHRRQCEELL